MSDFPHLSPQASVIAARSVPERIKWLQKGRLISIKPLRQIHDTLRRSVTGFSTSPAKPLTILMAPSGMGTSTMLQHLAQGLPGHFEAENTTHCYPIVMGHLPIDGRVGDLCAELCEIVAAPTFGVASVASQAPACLKLLKSLGLRLLVVDDCAALSQLTPSRREPILNFIRLAISRFDIRVLLNITPLVAPILSKDEQLFSRAQMVEVMPFKSQDIVFERFLTEYQKWCPLRNESDLIDDMSLRRALILRSNGVTRNLIDLLFGLSAMAILSGEERITYKLYKDYLNQAEYPHD
ncbi:TniB family NTP-binding protein [Roseovarius sp. EL26]|uniref:TniB family NTP-binding protein n=1 Tax=Roseovarius sp. EL26 TaxID=2126672 RepID=UPI000EA261B8|nr:TniB family NTP-binding protein [Roseovarius sp. EL26]